MTAVAWMLVAAPVGLFAYAYAVYPLLLRLRRGGGAGPGEAARAAGGRALPDGPAISVVVVAFNAERTIGRTLEQVVAATQLVRRRQVLVVSDASSDRTDDIVREFANRGVTLRRMGSRVGKTMAENAVAPDVLGDVVVSVDSSVLVPPGSIEALLRYFDDPAVGVASGRVVSVPPAAGGERPTSAEAAYYDYEMRVRALEMQSGAVIGAAGALYAVRRELYQVPLPAHVTRDFASPLLARERGYRSVIEERAVCYVPQTPSLRREYARKLRTMLQGLDTLYEFRHLMNPRRHGWFALMLISHKLCRWLVYLTAPLGAVGLVMLATEWWPARVALVAGAIVAGVGFAGVRWPRARRLPTIFAVCGYAVVASAAGTAAWRRFLRGEHMAVWEPTARPG